MKDDFDIKKRTEYPMDYLKAMELILETPVTHKPYVFKKIYEITRLHLPDLLYKYYSLTDDDYLNTLKLDTLRDQKIYMSDIESLNDPFDSKAFFYKSEELMKYKELEPHYGKVFDDISSFFRISSFTENGVNSMPMWAHYSNNHSGFCISYDMENTDNTNLLGCMFPVQYSEKRIDITNIMDEQVMMITSEKKEQMNLGRKKILIEDMTLSFIVPYLSNIKHVTWSYEKEFRCTVGSNSEGMPFFKAIPHEIYIGRSCSPNNAKKLVEIAYELNIPAFQMRFDEYDIKYKLVPQKVI